MNDRQRSAWTSLDETVKKVLGFTAHFDYEERALSAKLLREEAAKKKKETVRKVLMEVAERIESIEESE